MERMTYNIFECTWQKISEGINNLNEAKWTILRDIKKLRKNDKYKKTQPANTSSQVGDITGTSWHQKDEKEMWKKQIQHKLILQLRGKDHWFFQKQKLPQLLQN